jgi:hypothetical protein
MLYKHSFMILFFLLEFLLQWLINLSQFFILSVLDVEVILRSKLHSCLHIESLSIVRREVVNSHANSAGELLTILSDLCLVSVSMELLDVPLFFSCIHRLQAIRTFVFILL